MIFLRVVLLTLAAVAILFSILAVSEIGSANQCTLDLNWFGCTLRSHEALSGSLFGGLLTLAAAWIAWSAVQQQIEAMRALALSDRADARRLLSDGLKDAAEGLSAVWRIANRLQDGRFPGDPKSANTAISWAISRITVGDVVDARKQMVKALGWEDQINFASLVNEMDALQPFSNVDNLGDYEDLMDVIRLLSFNFEVCLPGTAQHFQGFPRGCPKAMSFGDLVRRIAGVEGQEGFGDSDDPPKG